MSLIEILPYVLLGGVLGLDVVSFPQAMVSRPIVAATVAGAFAGNALHGLMLGAIVELFALEMLAVGASRYPEWGSASVVGGALFAGSAPSLPLAPSLAAAIIATLVVAWIGGWSMYGLRRLNGVRARRALPKLERGDSDEVSRLQLVGLTSDFVRGALLAGVGIAVLAPLANLVADGGPIPDTVYLVAIWGLALAAAVSALWVIIRGSSGAEWWLAAGLVAGVGIVVLR
ncbi:MAG TPA: PTS sugar transporter subunit IIC [Gemmatimonadaceae bacterium]|nr:PTS sugar transporter subunit IIC [Gemmatimonadaceae bacterium]